MKREQLAIMQSVKPREIKPLDIVEISASIPQEQLNTLRQIIIRYILDHNSEEVAYRLLDMTHTRLREDVKFWITNRRQ